jgi:hypothetical protein
LRFLPVFDAETDAELIEEVMRIGAAMHAFVGPEAEDAFRAYFAARFLGHKRRLGLFTGKSPKPLRGRAPGDRNGVVSARRAVLWGLELARDKDALARAKVSLSRWLDGPTKGLDPDIGHETLALAANALDAALFERLVEQVEHPSLPENRNLALRALANVDDPALLRKVLDLTLRIVLEPHEVSAVLWSAAENPRRRSIVFEWIGSKWNEIAVKWPGNTSWPVVQVVTFACEEEQRNALEKVLSDLEPLHGAWIAKYFEEAARCHGLLEWAKDSVGAYFNPGLSKRR